MDLTPKDGCPFSIHPDIVLGRKCFLWILIMLYGHLTNFINELAMSSGSSENFFPNNKISLHHKLVISRKELAKKENPQPLDYSFYGTCCKSWKYKWFCLYDAAYYIVFLQVGNAFGPADIIYLARICVLNQGFWFIFSNVYFFIVLSRSI